ncbi:LtrC [Lactiplantibacillus plantarum]|uniref:LtrC n=1 Tax=Lactiplantibacillus plantarum TaxID=1590 RepID=UPI0021A31948|nr:LtrC [Lactiplantibacillus plantarum]
MSEDKNIDPILTPPSTLKSKKVTVDGNNDFSSGMPDITSNIPTVRDETKVKNLQKISSTQRVSPATKEKIKLLDYFLPKTEDKDTSFNGVVLRLIDSYIDNNLGDRQKKTFKEMYEKRIDELTR